MKHYSDLFFDLDNTLWNFEHSSVEALKVIYKEFGLERFFDSFEQFFKKYEQLNKQLWDKYRAGKIDKDTLSVTRFLYLIQEQTGELLPQLAQQIASRYLAQMTAEPWLEPLAFETVRSLHQKGYRIHIITDGFFEVQIVKLQVAKLSGFISQLITAEEVGELKPSKKLFLYALQKANASAANSLLIGDDYENDILGARAVGIDQVFYNRKGIDVDQLPIKPTFTIESLPQLLEIL